MDKYCNIEIEMLKFNHKRTQSLNKVHKRPHV